MILTNFEDLNFISNIFQETHDFLVLTDPVITCICLRTTNRHFRDQGNVRHPTSKLLKCDLVQTLNTFRDPSLRNPSFRNPSLLPGRHLLFSLILIPSLIQNSSYTYAFFINGIRLAVFKYILFYRLVFPCFVGCHFHTSLTLHGLLNISL